MALKWYPGERRRVVVQWPVGTDVDPRIVKITEAEPIAIVYGQLTAPAAGQQVCGWGVPDTVLYFIGYSLSVADSAGVGKRIDLNWTSFDGVLLGRFASVSYGGGLSGFTGARLLGGSNIVRAITGVAGAADSVYTAHIAVWTVPS